MPSERACFVAQSPLKQRFDPKSLFSAWANRYHVDRRCEFGAQELHVIARCLREILDGADLRDVFAPAGEAFVDRLYARELARGSRHVFDLLAIKAISRADFDFFVAAQDIKLHERNISDAVDADRVLERDDVEPAAASWSACRCAKLVTFAADAFAELAVNLGLKGA
jgi:hypothetical protein